MAMLQQAIPAMMTVVSALLLVETGKVQMEPTLEPQLLPVDGKILTPLRQPRAALLQVVDGEGFLSSQSRLGLAQQSLPTLMSR